MSYISDIAEAITKIKSDCKFAVRGENKNTDQKTLDDCVLEWHDGETPISKEDIKTEMDKL
tara:strand:- start:1277 stop:1459 length:183 start_codon:yes stop_codon:yes gene_type:complete